MSPCIPTVKPDKIIIKKSGDRKFHFDSPVTWNCPHSYFPLQFQVKVVGLTDLCDHTHKVRKVTRKLFLKFS